MWLIDHMTECAAKLGKPYTEVHKWLDEFFNTPKYGTKHRRVRHHLAGIEEARKLFGDGGAEAARLHIISDLKMDIWKQGRDSLPADEEEYVERGYW